MRPATGFIESAPGARGRSILILILILICFTLSLHFLALSLPDGAGRGGGRGGRTRPQRFKKKKKNTIKGRRLDLPCNGMHERERSNVSKSPVGKYDFHGEVRSYRRGTGAGTGTGTGRVYFDPLSPYIQM